MTDPFEQLAVPVEARAPRPAFARDLRARLVAALGVDASAAHTSLIAATPEAGASAASARAIPTDVPTIKLTERTTMATPATRAARPQSDQTYVDGIWSVVSYADPEAGIRFITDVLGFTEQVLVRKPDGHIIHSEYRWPEGGIVQLAAADPDNPFAPTPGQNGGVYVITQDPHAVWERCRHAAGVEVLRPPEEPPYDPGGMGFAIRDPEGNIWAFGSYSGGSTG